MSKIDEAKAALMTGVLVNFMPQGQRNALLLPLRGEEAEYIANVVLNVAKIIESMPKTYETERVESKDKIVHLHYFRGNVDAWIVERDVGDLPTDNGLGKQIQAFGMQSFGGIEDAEWGYVSIQELIRNGVELDLYWVPKRVKDLK